MPPITPKAGWFPVSKTKVTSEFEHYEIQAPRGLCCSWDVELMSSKSLKPNNQYVSREMICLAASENESSSLVSFF